MEQESADGPDSIGSGGEQLDINDPDSIAAEHRGLPRDRMEFDQEEDTGMKNPSFSILTFLRQVMEDETKDAGTVIGDFGLLLIAVHAAFLDSGFLVHCRGAGKRLPTGWASKQNLVIPISYTTLALGDVCDETVHPIKVKFSQIGKLVSVYVSVSGSLGVYRESFYLPSFIPTLRSAMSMATMEKDAEARVLELWKMVKDGLCLPLLIDVSMKYGLSPPPCFTCLPTDVKIRILELLRGDDLARIGCTNKEMKNLSSNDELWSKKFNEEFDISSQRCLFDRPRWKDRFSIFWITSMKKYDTIPSRSRDRRVEYCLPPPHWRNTAPPLYSPLIPRFNIFGGYYDRYPFFGEIDGWSGSSQHSTRLQSRWNMPPGPWMQ